MISGGTQCKRRCPSYVYPQIPAESVDAHIKDMYVHTAYHRISIMSRVDVEQSRENELH